MNHKHQKTLAKIFQHPMSHDLKWQDVVKLLEALEVEIELKHSGASSLKLNGIEASLPRHTHTKVSNQHELMGIRHFLQKAGVQKA
ncbi:MAG: hypothetical protein QM479_04550, partial [Pseudomonadota bacterium]